MRAPIAPIQTQVRPAVGSHCPVIEKDESQNPEPHFHQVEKNHCSDFVTMIFLHLASAENITLANNF